MNESSGDKKRPRGKDHRKALDEWLVKSAEILEKYGADAKKK